MEKDEFFIISPAIEWWKFVWSLAINHQFYLEKKRSLFSPLVHTNFLPLRRCHSNRQPFDSRSMAQRRREISSSLKNVELAHNRMASRQHEEDECGGRRRRNERETPSKKFLFAPVWKLLTLPWLLVDIVVSSFPVGRALTFPFFKHGWDEKFSLSFRPPSAAPSRWNIFFAFSHFVVIRQKSQLLVLSYRFSDFLFATLFLQFFSLLYSTTARRVLLFHDGKIKQTNKHSKWKSIFTRSFCTEWENEAKHREQGKVEIKLK